MPPMSTGRIGAAATVVSDGDEELIFVTGGSDGDQALCSGEVFNPSTQTWEAKT